MVKSIKELYDKLEKREKKYYREGKETTGSHVLFANSFRIINDQSSSVYSVFISNEKNFCDGFLYGLLCSHYITKDEFEVLKNELSSAYEAYLDRMCAS